MFSLVWRDDDLSGVTDTDAFAELMEPLWSRFPVSLSVIPFVRPRNERTIGEVVPIESNSSLVAILRDQIDKGRVEILLHGYHHNNDTVKSGNGFIPEFQGKVDEGKRYLERILKTKVRVFVPPHSRINNNDLRELSACEMDIGAALSCFSLKYRIRTRLPFARLQNRSLPLLKPVYFNGCRVLEGWRTHEDDDAPLLHALTRYADGRGGILCIVTHYWELINHPPLRKVFTEWLISLTGKPHVTFATFSRAVEGYVK